MKKRYVPRYDFSADAPSASPLPIPVSTRGGAPQDDIDKLIARGYTPRDLLSDVPRGMLPKKTKPSGHPVIGAGAGGLLGLLTAGPVGAVIGAGAGYLLANWLSHPKASAKKSQGHVMPLGGMSQGPGAPHAPTWNDVRSALEARERANAPKGSAASAPAPSPKTISQTNDSGASAVLPPTNAPFAETHDVAHHPAAPDSPIAPEKKKSSGIGSFLPSGLAQGSGNSSASSGRSLADGIFLNGLFGLGAPSAAQPMHFPNEKPPPSNPHGPDVITVPRNGARERPAPFAMSPESDPNRFPRVIGFEKTQSLKIPPPGAAFPGITVYVPPVNGIDRMMVRWVDVPEPYKSSGWGIRATAEDKRNSRAVDVSRISQTSPWRDFTPIPGAPDDPMRAVTFTGQPSAKIEILWGNSTSKVIQS